MRGLHSVVCRVCFAFSVYILPVDALIQRDSTQKKPGFLYSVNRCTFYDLPIEVLYETSHQKVHTNHIYGFLNKRVHIIYNASPFKSPGTVICLGFQKGMVLRQIRACETILRLRGRIGGNLSHDIHEKCVIKQI